MSKGVNNIRAKGTKNETYITVGPAGLQEYVQLGVNPKPEYINAIPSKLPKDAGYVVATENTNPIYNVANAKPTYLDPSTGKPKDAGYFDPKNLVGNKSNSTYVKLGENPEPEYITIEDARKATDAVYNVPKTKNPEYLDPSTGEPTYQILNKPISPIYNVLNSNQSSEIKLGQKYPTPPKFEYSNVKKMVPEDQLPNNLVGKVPYDVHNNIVGIVERRLKNNKNKPEYREKYNKMYEQIYKTKMQISNVGTENIYMPMTLQSEEQKHEENYPNYEFIQKANYSKDKR